MLFVLCEKNVLCVWRRTTTGKRVSEREKKATPKLCFSQISDSKNKIKELPRKLQIQYCGKSSMEATFMYYLQWCFL